MFNRGIDALLEALPSLSNLSPAQIRRLLTLAWIETTDLRWEDTGQADDPEAARLSGNADMVGDLRRLAAALEVHAILPFGVERATVRACAFVAAEAIAIANDLAPDEELEQLSWLFGSARRFERVESGLLYLIAGYDSNAALTVSGLADQDQDGSDPEAAIAGWAFTRIRALLTLSRITGDEPVPAQAAGSSLRSSVRHELWRRIGAHVEEHVRWLTFDSQDDPQAGAALREIADQLEQRSQQLASSTRHADLHHLALLVAAACDETGLRALRNVPPPEGDSGRFTAYQGQRGRTRPLLWPAAHEYAERALPGPHAHAVVSVPTGAGKSSVAELAVAQALHSGWVLYLAPTNALVGQIRRHTADIFGRDTVREFLGGAEYTELSGESLADIEDRQVLVMTPEKCSLALRQNPEAFARLALCVVDEAHILGERNGRGVIAELVLAEILHRAPGVRLLLLSALIANPGDLAGWLEHATGIPVAVIDQPWRPTRTLRAIAGFDHDRLDGAGDRALAVLEGMPEWRKANKFAAPLAVLAGLQGAWRSDDPNDYSHVKTDIEVQLSVNRRAQIDPAGYFTRASIAVVQRLGERGDRILAFLPRSKHDSFAAAETISGFGAQPCDVGETVEAFLTLADAELGVATALRAILQKRVAVHTSALLREEQRASEVAFNEEIALAMFATGTMAQGLNLPATAVVIGGTDIGYDSHDTAEQKRQRTRAQLLNAIGRAGRAYVAARSMALVVPNKPIYIDSAEDISAAARSAEFLKEEDASTAISSALDGLVAAALSGELSVETMSDADQTAFTFLSFAGRRDETEGVLAKTWAADRAAVLAQAHEIAGTVEASGREFLERTGAPPWIAVAAHRSGIALPGIVTLHQELRTRLAGGDQPQTIIDWARLMIALLGTMPPHELQRILPRKAYGESSRLAGIYSADPAERGTAWTAYERALAAWMTGRPLIEVADRIHAKPVNGNARRRAQDPLPRTITVVNDGFRFGLSMVAGALGAIVTTGRDEDPEGPWELPEESLRCLTLLPLAVRSGAATPEVLAWIRAGAQPRVTAHILSSIAALPEALNDDELQRHAYSQLRELTEGAAAGIALPQHQPVLRALGIIRDAR
jgi:superfamily II DNA/RNA helicase